ncbi:MAG: porin family protein [Cardiobacteriaceae bacterium]|nr:porin family protein [Cardiobacteriaceae bacterium]
MVAVFLYNMRLFFMTGNFTMSKAKSGFSMSLRAIAVFGVSSAIFTASAQEKIAINIEQDNDTLAPNAIESNPAEALGKPLANTLPSYDEQKSEDIVFMPEELIANPKQLESLLVQAIYGYEVEGLKLLIPLYTQVETRDESLVEWGNALIAMNANRTAEAVALYRKLISHFPDNQLLRFQTAMALYRNNEMIAAKDQFEKLRATKLSQKDLEVINEFITQIDKRDEWAFEGSLSYIHDNNINNVAPKGTKILLGNGFELISNRDPEKAQGVDFSFGANKKWSINDNFYSSFAASVDGVHYFGKRKYDDITARISGGVGYRTSTIDLELTPYFQKRFYGQGGSGDGELHAYSTSAGLQLNGGYWFTPKWKYQGVLEYGYDDHIDSYSYLDGKRINFSNTFFFAPSQKQYWYAGLDTGYKDARSGKDAYNRHGIRLGWGQEWGKGISTRLTGGIAKRYAKGGDLFGIERKDKEYNASLSLWHRNLHFWGITPKLVFSHSKVKSNNLFYNYDTNKFYLDFSKSF